MMASERGKASGRTEEMGSGTGRWLKMGSGRRFKIGIARAAAILIFSAVTVAGQPYTEGEEDLYDYGSEGEERTEIVSLQTPSFVPDLNKECVWFQQASKCLLFCNQRRRASPDVGNIGLSIKSSSKSDPRQLGHHDDGDGGGSLDKISDQLLMTNRQV